jgi:hypothetical protein
MASSSNSETEQHHQVANRQTVPGKHGALGECFGSGMLSRLRDETTFNLLLPLLKKS